MATQSIAQELPNVRRGFDRLRSIPPSYIVVWLVGMYEAWLAAALFARPTAPELIYLEAEFGLQASDMVLFLLLGSILLTGGYMLFHSINAIVPGLVPLVFLSYSVTRMVIQSDTSSYARIVEVWGAVMGILALTWLAIQYEDYMERHRALGPAPEAPHG